MDPRVANALNDLSEIGIAVIPKGPPPVSEGWFAPENAEGISANTAKRHYDRAVAEGQMDYKDFRIGRATKRFYRLPQKTKKK